MKSKRIGDLQTVKNSKKHWAAKDKYNYIRVQLENGKELKLLFTDAEITRAQTRASNNPEDLPVISKIRDIFD
jgi:hypothetical protein